MSSDAVRYVLERLGFRPLRSSGPFIEFSKLYADGEGQMARAVVQLERPDSNLRLGAPYRLAGFVTEVRRQIGPSEAEAMSAPLVMRDDLTRALRDLSSLPQPLPVVLCIGCGEYVSTFGARGFCLECEVTHA